MTKFLSLGLTENITNEDIESLQQVRIMYNTCVDLGKVVVRRKLAHFSAELGSVDENL